MKANHAGQVNKRRQKALLRLEEQLETGRRSLNSSQLKDMKDEEYNKCIELGYIPLDEKDMKRIKLEISILNSRVMTDESARAVRTKRKR